MLKYIAIARVYEQMRIFSTLVSVRHEEVVRETEQFLETIGNLPSFQSTGKSDECQLLSAKFMEEHEEYVNIGAILPTGEIVCSGIVPKESVNIAFRPYIQEALDKGVPSVSGYQMGVVSDKPVFTVAYPVKGEDGTVKTIILASVSLSWLRFYNSKTPLSPGISIMIIDRSGVLLDYLQGTGLTAGRKVGDLPLVQKVFEKSEGTIREIGLDGKMGLFAFTRLGGIPPGNAYVVAGIDESRVVGELRATFVKSMLFMVPLSLLASVLVVAVGHTFFHTAYASGSPISGKK